MMWKGRPYHALKVYLERRFGFPVKRIALDGGFTCPNRDGTLGYGGCAYCGEEGARAGYVNPLLSVRDQLLERMRFWEERGFRGGYIAYFQAYTNTYADPARLEAMYESVLLPGVVGVFVGTRPDCLGDEVLDVMSRLAKKTWVMVEVGVQSTHDATLRYIRRGHDAFASREALTRLGERGIERLVHVIGGLPGEDREIFLKTIQDVQAWGCEAIKFHHLFVEKNTLLAHWYEKGEVALLSREAYIAWVGEALAHLSGEVVIHRLFGECDRERLIAPLWTLEKLKNIEMLKQWMREHDLWQGKYR